MSILKVNVMRAPEMASIFGMWGLLSKIEKNAKTIFPRIFLPDDFGLEENEKIENYPRIRL